MRDRWLMGFIWKEGDEIAGALYIGKISDGEKKRVAAIAVTSFKVIGSVNADKGRQWLLEPLELCLVEDAGDDLVFTTVWQNDGVKLDDRKKSKQKAFMEMVGEFGPDADVGSYGDLVKCFFEDQLIETNAKMIANFDMPISMSGKDKERGATRPVQYKYEYISERPRREKGIWQFVATDASKKDEDERLKQMEHIVRMGQLMLKKHEKAGPRKRFSHLN